MRNAPVVYAQAPVATPEALSPGAEETARAALADGTKELYRAIAGKLDEWLQARGWEPGDLAIAEFLQHEHERGIAPGTISLIPAAVRYAAKMGGYPNPIGPQCKRVLAGVRREGAGRGNGQVKGLSWSEAERVAAVAVLGEPGARDFRDAALVALASDCLLRVGEVVSVRVADITAEADGSGRLTVRRSKTDQLGVGVVLYIGPPTMAALRDWLEVGEIERGPVFRRVRRGGHTQAGAISATAARAILTDTRAGSRDRGQGVRPQPASGRRAIVGSGRGRPR